MSSQRPSSANKALSIARQASITNYVNEINEYQTKYIHAFYNIAKQTIESNPSIQTTIDFTILINHINYYNSYRKTDVYLSREYRFMIQNNKAILKNRNTEKSIELNIKNLNQFKNQFLEIINEPIYMKDDKDPQLFHPMLPIETQKRFEGIHIECIMVEIGKYKTSISLPFFQSIYNQPINNLRKKYNIKEPFHTTFYELFPRRSYLHGGEQDIIDIHFNKFDVSKIYTYQTFYDLLNQQLKQIINDIKETLEQHPNINELHPNVLKRFIQRRNFLKEAFPLPMDTVEELNRLLEHPDLLQDFSLFPTIKPIFNEFNSIQWNPIQLLSSKKITKGIGEVQKRVEIDDNKEKVSGIISSLPPIRVAKTMDAELTETELIERMKKQAKLRDANDARDAIKASEAESSSLISLKGAPPLKTQKGGRYEKLTVKELQEKCKTKKISYSGKKKAELIAALRKK